MLIKIQPDATVSRYFFTAKSLHMFRVSPHPSSGVLKTVTATSGTGHNTGTATSLQRGQIGPRWREVAFVVNSGFFYLGNTNFITNPTCNFKQHYYDILDLILLLVWILIVLPMRYKIFSLVFLCVVITIINFYLKIFHSLSSFILSAEPLTSCYVYFYNGLEHFLSCVHCCLQNLLALHCLYKHYIPYLS